MPRWNNKPRRPIDTDPDLIEFRRELVREVGEEIAYRVLLSPAGTPTDFKPTWEPLSLDEAVQHVGHLAKPLSDHEPEDLEVQPKYGQPSRWLVLAHPDSGWKPPSQEPSRQVDLRPALPYLLLVGLSALLGGAFAGTVEASYQNWVMGVLAGLTVTLFIVLAAVSLTAFGDTLKGRPRNVVWTGLLLATIAAFLSGAEILKEFPWPMQWGFPLLCLLPLYLIPAASRAIRPPRRR